MRLVVHVTVARGRLVFEGDLAADLAEQVRGLHGRGLRRAGVDLFHRLLPESTRSADLVLVFPCRNRQVKVEPTAISGAKDAPAPHSEPRAEPGGSMTGAEAAGGRWPPRAAFLTVAIGILLAQGAYAEDRPSAIAPYRYISPPSAQLDSLESQKAYSYRNELSAQRRSMEMDRALNRNPDVNAASRLRSEGELSREGDRIDSVLQR
jgi:hypothetical protein